MWLKYKQLNKKKLQYSFFDVKNCNRAIKKEKIEYVLYSYNIGNVCKCEYKHLLKTQLQTNTNTNTVLVCYAACFTIISFHSFT